MCEYHRTLGRGTHMGRVPRQKDTTRSELFGYLRVTVETCRVFNALKAQRGQVAADRGRSVRHQIGGGGRWP